LARNAFSKSSIESNLSAGDFGVDVGQVWRREKEKSNATETSTQRQDQEYYAVYIHPRARIFLHEDELQVSSECADELRRLQANPSMAGLQRFYRLFGHVFVTSVLLGGQQKTTKFAGAFQRQDHVIQQDALRWAVGAKVNAPYANVGIEYTRAKGHKDTTGENDYINSSYLALSATGGDTLIGSDIPKWAPTVAPYKDWRVVKNEIAIPIHELIGALPNWQHVPNLIRNVQDTTSIYGRPWRGKFSLQYRDQYLAWDRNTFCLRQSPADTGNSPGAIFHAVTYPSDAEQASHLDAVSFPTSAPPYLELTFPVGHWKVIGAIQQYRGLSRSTRLR
jgi:hypothetical protein